MSSPTGPHSTNITDTTPNNAAEAHKARTNSDIINLFKKPPISDANPPSIKGIGLYTHIAAPTNPSPEIPSHPVFLPITQTPTGKAPFNPHLPDEIRDLCSDIRDLIRDEEAAVANRSLSFDELTKRYAGLPVRADVLGDATALAVRAKGDVVMREDGGGRQGVEREVGVQSGSRRVSVDVAGSGVAGREDVVMREVEEETARKLPPGTHIYREDPRRRR
ncbi:hypothetical protein COCMIDRAFT_103747 [Bipolaris oryzae ATCC 44560]|uniref:Uncharacterized protein n=1 Tax=Bipolaris oryzae ATCC 44560 TaxID=930090 RepID=W6YSC4_COCMI|nr:uncharacterized protein COCMIDRAFT_103747 [Bipolaris oryzae ATCC 44560]EUC42347.1 hypothetical protein COCMIDRAFT_103747 [Bipolaris oryzae ATCC 44560]